MGDTVTRAVDLEARRRTMGENLQRFRQVEQRLQPPARPRLGTPAVFPAPAPPSPVEAEAQRRAGITAAQVAPLVQEAEQVRGPGLVERGIGAGLGLAERGVSAALTEIQRRPMLGGPFAEPEGGGPTMAEEWRTRYSIPMGAAGLQRTAQVTRPVREMLHEALPAKGPILAPPREGYVDPFKAMTGDKAEQQKAAIYIEEAGLAGLVAEVVFDLANLLPGVGFTKTDDAVRLFSRISKLTGKSRDAVMARPTVQRLVAKLGEEAGGTRLGAGEAAAGRAAAIEEQRALKTLVQEGRATPQQEARLTELQGQLQRGEFRAIPERVPTEAAKAAAQPRLTAPYTPGTRSRIGEEIRTAIGDSIFTDSRRVGGVDYELYAGKGADKGFIRVVDGDSGNVVSMKTYPTFQRASTEHRGAVAAAMKAEMPIPARPPTGVEPAGVEPSTTIGQALPATPEGAPAPGTKVRAADRGNIGTVSHYSEDGRTAYVYFHNRKTGLQETVPLRAGSLEPIGGRRPREPSTGIGEPPRQPPEPPVGEVPPPREPPVSVPEPEPAPPSRPDIGERSWQKAGEALAYKATQLERPGRYTRIPVLQHLASVVFPNIKMSFNTLLAHVGRQAVRGDLTGRWRNMYRPVTEALERAFKEVPPTYIGPTTERRAYLIGTIKDFADNPDLYTDVSPALAQAREAYDAVSTSVLKEARQYGVDIEALTSDKPGWFYLGTMDKLDAADDAGKALADAHTSASARGGAAKHRLWESAAARSEYDATFQAETDLARLTDAHVSMLTNRAGGETFRLGTGGLNGVQVKDLTHPGLRAAKEGMQTRVRNLKARIDTAYRQIKQGTTAGKRLDTAVAQAERRASPLQERVAALGEEWGPELSHLSGQVRELEARAAALGKIRGAVGGRRAAAEMRLAELQAEVRKLEPELRTLIDRYQGAKPGDYVFSGKTNRWHTAKEAAEIEQVLKTKLGWGDSLTQAIEEWRVTNFGGDMSPFSQQGLLGVAANPVNAARNIKGLIDQLLTGRPIARELAENPEMVARFSRSSGRTFGTPLSEFFQPRAGPGRIPILGKIWVKGNERVYSVVEYLVYKGWAADSAALERGGALAARADGDAMNMWSKIVPQLNPAERGVSALGARMERLPFTTVSFAVGPAGLVKDATTGLMKLGLSREISPAARWATLSGRQQIAVVRSLQLTGSLATLSMGSYIASGYSPEEAARLISDPKRGRFLSVAIGKNRYIPLGGPLRGLVKAIWPQPVDGVPFPVPFVGLPKWAQAKITPAIRTGRELYRNKDYHNRKIMKGEFPENILRGLWFVAENMLPLTVGAVSEEVRTGETDIGRIGEQVGAQFMGAGIYETGPYERLKTAWQEKYPDKPFDQTSWKIAEQDPALAPLVQRVYESGAERGTPGAERRANVEQARLDAERSTGLVMAAENIAAGKPAAKAAFATSFADYTVQMVGTNRVVYEGMARDAGTEAEKAVDAYYAFMDNMRNDQRFYDASGAFDKDAAYTELDKLYEATPQDWRTAVEKDIRSVNPIVQQYEPEYREAKRLRNDLFDLPHWRGVSPEQEKEMEDFLGQVEDARRFWASNNGVEVPVADAIPAVAEKLGKEPNFVQWAILLRPGTKTEEELREPQYRQFLKDNRDKLEPYFPDLYGIGMLAEMFNETGGVLPSQAPVNGGTQTMPNIRMRPAGVR